MLRPLGIVPLAAAATLETVCQIDRINLVDAAKMLFPDETAKRLYAERFAKALRTEGQLLCPCRDRFALV